MRVGGTKGGYKLRMGRVGKTHGSVSCLEMRRWAEVEIEVRNNIWTGMIM